jgi:hypothetical protein
VKRHDWDDENRAQMVFWVNARFEKSRGQDFSEDLVQERVRVKDS